VVTSLPFTDALETFEATRDPEDLVRCTGDDGRNVWYRFVPDHDGTFCVRTNGSDYPAVPHPLVGSCTGNGVYDDSFCGERDTLTFRASANVPILVQLSDPFRSLGRGEHLVVTIADAAADTDGDGVPDCADVCIGVPDPDQQDSDYDGVGDACDTCIGPGADLDGDGYCGDWDRCPTLYDPGDGDVDFDGFGDACDTCPGFGTVDTDGDGICDEEDNCPTVANPTQFDSDGDGIGSACDPCWGYGPDTDGDGWCDESDNCPTVYNPGQEDSDDTDGFGDACDSCPGYGTVDTDGDGVCDEADDCPTIVNPDQRDGDGDGIGDACDVCPAMPLLLTDTDSDGDGRPNLCDACTDDPTDACATLLGITGSGGLVRVGKNVGGSFVTWTGLNNAGSALAVQPGTGTLFTLTFDYDLQVLALATVDPTTGASHVVGPIGLHDPFIGLTFAQNGRLFALGRQNDRLVTIDPATGAAADVGSLGLGRGDGHGIAFDRNGDLLLADDTRLLAIDPGDATLKPIVALHMPSYCGQDGHFVSLGVAADGSLLGLLYCGWSYLATIDRATGVVALASQNMAVTGVAFPIAPCDGCNVERCGNCADDDGDGLVDVEDPDCCTEGTGTLDVTRAWITPHDGGTAVRLAGRVAGTGELPPAGATDVRVQLSGGADGKTVCADIPAAALAPRSGGVVFTDLRGKLASARGIRSLALRARPQNGGAMLSLVGRKVPLVTPTGPVAVTLALHPSGGIASANRCYAGTARPR
jgi:hypothetical protein